MQRGDTVLVLDAFGNKLLRKVADCNGTILFVCLPEEWELAQSEKREPSSIGFRIWDVVNEGK